MNLHLYLCRHSMNPTTITNVISLCIPQIQRVEHWVKGLIYPWLRFHAWSSYLGLSICPSRDPVLSRGLSIGIKEISGTGILSSLHLLSFHLLFFYFYCFPLNYFVLFTVYWSLDLVCLGFWFNKHSYSTLWFLEKYTNVLKFETMGMHFTMRTKEPVTKNEYWFRW